ncbi:MAG: prefoldin subunit beta [Promethearchaeota archaeon]
MSINLDNLSEDVKQKILNLQKLQQTFDFLTTQKLQIDTSLQETELAIEELEKTNPEEIVYKSIGGILVRSDRDKLLAEKKSMKTTLEMRSKTLTQKLDRTKNQIETMRKSLEADLRNQ